MNDYWHACGKNFLQGVDMDPSSTQHSPSIFNLNDAMCPKKMLKMCQIATTKNYKKKNQHSPSIFFFFFFGMMPCVAAKHQWHVC